MRLPKKLRGFTLRRELISDKLGFTLIELLVVISIIAILMAVAVVSYTQVQRRVRDQRRITDMALIATALQRFYQDNGAYPDEIGDSAAPDIPGYPTSSDYFTCSVDGVKPPAVIIVGNAPFTCGTNTYLNKVPVDPSTGIHYLYEINDDPAQPGPGFNAYPRWCNNPDTAGASGHGHCQKYTLWGKLENTNHPGVIATQNDPICQAAYNIEGWIKNAPPAGFGFNYCIHQP